MKKTYHYTDECIAVIGMACRFPGAENLDAFWEGLLLGRQGMVTLSREELGRGPHAALLEDPQYVPMACGIQGHDHFDADFFGLSPHEAAITDPQQRLLLEYAWKAFEHAGHAPGDSRGTATGVFASCGLSSYLLINLYGHLTAGRLDMTEALLGNDKDYAATRLAYKLNLRGPAMTIQSACSSSLTALHMACQALLGGECDRALVASATLLGPQLGYLYLEGGMRSPDGRCRPYDAKGQGTIFGSGVGAVLLRRLEDAQAQGDHILAVVRATAANNDGGDKVGFTAPGVNAQATVIAEALRLSGVSPWDVDFVEGHGTATPLGDPIEVAALGTAFLEAAQAPSPEGRSILLGSVKGNIGHLDATAGLAGFIKAVLCLRHGQVPGTANFKQLNPLFGQDIAPFTVRADCSALPEHGPARLGGVSAFGLGGTNVHIVLQGPPLHDDTADSPDGPLLFLLSGRDADGLFRTQADLAAHLDRDPPCMPDLAHTLLRGRAVLPARRAMVAASLEELKAALARRQDPARFVPAGEARPAAFLFPGQGAQHPAMAGSLYRSDQRFRELFRNMAEMVRAQGGPDLQAVLSACWEGDAAAAQRIAQTQTTQPLLFALEYALARLLMENGLRPAYLLGHSIGEYTAACLAGIFSEEDAARLVVARGAAMGRATGGAMLALSIGEGQLDMLPKPLRARVELAAANTSSSCVLSGQRQYLEACAEFLARAGEQGTLLKTSGAFHSSFMDAALPSFRDELERVPMRPPQLPVVSNLTGTWADASMATPEYWLRQLRGTIRFAQCLRTLFAQRCLGVELGPGRTLCSFARQELGDECVAVSALGGRGQREPESALEILGEVWTAGGELAWDGCPGIRPGRTVPLPGYAFARQRHWIAPLADATVAGRNAPSTAPAATLPKQSRASRDGYAPPTTESERILAEIWEELLLMRPVGVEDNFIELGGNSMHVLRMVRMGTNRGLHFTAKDVFTAKTIAALCRCMEQNGHMRRDGANAVGDRVETIEDHRFDGVSDDDLQAILAATGADK